MTKLLRSLLILALLSLVSSAIAPVQASTDNSIKTDSESLDDFFGSITDKTPVATIIGKLI